MVGNSSLAKAKGAKNDEFYTLLTDIEKELRHYRRHFKGKIVLCNCDDPFESNFFKYFALNFNRLGLKKLMATCYSGSPIAGTQLSPFVDDTEEERRTPYKAVVTSVHDANGDGGVEMDDVAELFKTGENTIERLEGNGSYDSPECLELLDEADIVVTNPPFSRFRDYISTLMRYGKKFVVIGGDKGRKYAEIFPFIKENKLWLGMTHPKKFFVPDEYENKAVKIDENGRRYMTMGNVCWYTNLDVKKRHEEMILVRRYSPDSYPRYVNFDGIDVAHVGDIPCDYPGNMGVPINYLDQYNPEQFEIVGLGEGDLAKEIGITRNHEGRTKLEYEMEDGTFKRPFARIVIRNLHPEQQKEV